MVLGLVYGRDRAEEIPAKDTCYAKVNVFLERFSEANGALRCRDLIDLDWNADGALQEFVDRGMLEKCKGLVHDSIRLIIELLAD